MMARLHPVGARRIRGAGTRAHAEVMGLSDPLHRGRSGVGWLGVWMPSTTGLTSGVLCLHGFGVAMQLSGVLSVSVGMRELGPGGRRLSPVVRHGCVP